MIQGASGGTVERRAHGADNTFHKVRRLVGLLLFCCFPLFVWASSGDRSVSFQNCLLDCYPGNCASPFPLSLRITRWTCQDDCAYHCSHFVTDAAEARIIAQKGATAVRIEQFYGKWAFWRLWGIQEPASVMFSLLNLRAHVKGLALLRRRVPQTHVMRWYYVAWSLISMNAWIWSAIFHTRGEQVQPFRVTLYRCSQYFQHQTPHSPSPRTSLDKPLTEKLDYFSAGLSILFGLYLAVIRLFHLYPPGSSAPSKRPSTIKSLLRHAWTTLCITAYLAHISYLIFAPRFDYGYNILANLMIGIAHHVLWILYGIPATPLKRFPFAEDPIFMSNNTRSVKPRQRWISQPLWCVLLMTCATMLELFDFPPWYRVIDAHSLWHLATAPIAGLWYQFLVEDSLNDGWVLHKLR